MERLWSDGRTVVERLWSGCGAGGGAVVKRLCVAGKHDDAQRK